MRYEELTDQGIELGLAYPAEAATIARMSRELIERDLGWRWRTARVARVIADPESFALVARHGRRIVGFALMRLDLEQAHLLLLAVDPGWRRLGIARAMLGWLDQAALVAGARCVWLEVRRSARPARAFYMRRGFERVAVVRGYYQGKEDALRLRLRLGVDIDEDLSDPLAELPGRPPDPTS